LGCCVSSAGQAGLAIAARAAAPAVLVEAAASLGRTAMLPKVSSDVSHKDIIS
jgi:hypothetical protein